MDEEKSEEENEESFEKDDNPVEKKEQPKKPLIKKPLNYWMISTIALGILLVLVLFTNITGNVITGNVISEGDAGEKLLDYLNSQTGGGVELIETSKDGEFYEVVVSYQGQEIPLYVTKDGEFMAQLTPLQIIDRPSETQQPQEIPKSDIPIVELFIMTHCPYGTQAEKGLIPVLETLGNKIEGSINFVHYFMHTPEEDETPIQVCIREEQPDKFLNYLKCFLEEGDSDTCLTKTGINKAKLNTCVENNAEDYYATDSEASENYGVQGSPTLVINGVQVSSARNSAAYLETVCSAFIEPPEECSEELSNENPSPGFGYSASGGSSSNAQC